MDILNALLDSEDVDRIGWGLHEINRKVEYANIMDAYYKGNHPLRFATEKFRNAFGALFGALSLNLCKKVVDVHAAQLAIDGFTLAGDTTDEELVGLPPAKPEPAETPDPENPDAPPAGAKEGIEKKTQEVWRLNRLAARSKQMFRQMFRRGGVYAIIWPDEQNRPIWYPQRAAAMCHEDEPENPGHIIRSAKVFVERKFIPRVVEPRYLVHMTIYEKEATYKYVSITPQTDSQLRLDPNQFKPELIEGELWPLPNPYGKCPVFYFPNANELGEDGTSEIEQVIPSQDALNKGVCDMMVGGEFVSYPQRWAVGLDVPKDPVTGLAKEVFKSGADRMFTAGKPDAKFGNFDVGDMTQFISIASFWKAAVCIIADMPPQYFLLAEGSADTSGETLKMLEHNFSQKIKDRQVSVGMVFEDAMRFSLMILGEEDVELSVQWGQVAYRDPKAAVEEAQAKVNLGVPKNRALQEIGYKPQEVAAFEKEADRVASKETDAQKAAIANGLAVPPQMPKGFGGGQ